MNPIPHRSNNATLTKPEDMTDGDCTSLPITRLEWELEEGKVQACISFWRPTPAQLALLQAGKPVWFGILGHTHPPIMLGVEGDGRLNV